MGGQSSIIVQVGSRVRNPIARASWLERYFHLAFPGFPIRIFAGTWIMLIDVLRVFPSPSRRTFGLKLGHDRSIPHPLQFVIGY
jgi:hypothetical protein